MRTEDTGRKKPQASITNPPTVLPINRAQPWLRERNKAMAMTLRSSGTVLKMKATPEAWEKPKVRACSNCATRMTQNTGTRA